jgi:hypothetical protein
VTHSKFRNRFTSLNLFLKTCRIPLGKKLIFGFLIYVTSLGFRLSSIWLTAAVFRAYWSGFQFVKVGHSFSLQRSLATEIAVSISLLSSIFMYFEYSYILKLAMTSTKYLFKQVIEGGEKFFPSHGLHTPRSEIIRSGAIGYVRPIQVFFILLYNIPLFFFSQLLLLFVSPIF